VSLILDSFLEAGAAERLAGVAAAEEVDAGDVLPFGFGDVAQVGDVGVVVLEDRRGARVGVGDPCELAAEDGLDGRFETAVARAEGSDAERHAAAFLLLSQPAQRCSRVVVPHRNRNRSTL
jgi:hypothetical protein